ncbi:methyltransferase domain-containing protein [Tsukamurella serpentis]
MRERHDDGSAGDVDYGLVGGSYSQFRRPDPRIAEAITSALGDARTVLNVGAGAGSYEPADREVTAVEPSRAMREQRAPHLAPAIDGVAEDLPFPNGHFDASMTTFSVHQWSDARAGLMELRRVTRGPVVVLTADPNLVDRFWLSGYAPAVIAAEQRRYPPMDLLCEALGGASVTGVPIPLDCVDGFNEAYYGRPEMLLSAPARTSCSAWSFVDARTSEGYVAALADDLAAGRWDERHGYLRRRPTFDGSLVLVVSPAA